MKSLFKDPAVLLIAIVSILSLTNFVSTILFLIILFITDLVIIAKDGLQILKQKSFKLLSIFYIIFVIYGFLDHGVLAKGAYKPEIFSFILIYSVFIISYHIKFLEIKQIKIVLTISLIAFSICLGITTYIASINPMAIRLCFRDVEGSEELEASIYRSMGIISYALAHAISVISVGTCALFCYAKKKWLRIFSLLLWVTMIKLLFDMTITTALVLSVLCSLIVIVNKLSKGRVSSTVILYIILILLFFSSSLVTNVLNFAETSNTQIFLKLNDLFNSIETGSGQGHIDVRDQLYSVSLNTFLSNPIFGWGKDNGSRTIIGEHSFFLDYLAYYGIFALLYFFAWWVQYKSVLIDKFKRYKITCILCFLPVCMMIVLKASSVCTSMPFASLVFLQLVFAYLNTESPSLHKNHKKENSNRLEC